MKKDKDLLWEAIKINVEIAKSIRQIKTQKSRSSGYIY